MTSEIKRKPVDRNRHVRCLDDVIVTLDHCRFCVHSESFIISGRAILSPARAYCLRHRATDNKINLSEVEAIDCDDTRGEGYRSIMNIIT